MSPRRKSRLRRTIDHYRFLHGPGASRRKSWGTARWLTQNPRQFDEPMPAGPTNKEKQDG